MQETTAILKPFLRTEPIMNHIYAQNGFFQEPTSRFSDGRIIVDFIDEYAKLPLIPPYLQPHIADFSNGVNFASGGAGVLSTTHPDLVINLEKQLKYFEQVQKSLAEKLGAAKAEEVISEAVYFISIGSNDYMGGYFALRALNPGVNYDNEEAVGGCFEAASDLALAHNNALSIVLTSLQHILQGFKYCNSNFYDWLLHRVNNPSKYGFKEGVKACCGTGPYGGDNTCGGTKEYEICDNARDYVWFDSFHPTEGIHEQFAKALWDGPSSSVGPYTLQDLFFGKEKQTIADIVDI
ncbi:gdsl esteraselipase 2 [Nicotiana attenuata]|uniref:Gdsl esteraselipase 2 n=1 Tax=Nicotiana attenuata TaxID=49451 RepID=A0A1J6IUF5_NICAT|nr:gdsl esteraselipase 2 [Nicotiana attenuata]